jgi:hypothetical protein
VGVAELGLDDREWDSFVGHLDCVGVAELVWSERASHAGLDGEVTRFCARACG